MPTIRMIAGLVWFGLQTVTSALAQTTTPAELFFRNKTINILVGFQAGGGYDLYARVLAQFLGPTDVQFYFIISRDHSDQHFGDLVISNEFWQVGTMPSGCTVHIDERKPENCQINFDANTYDRNEMRAVLDQYLRLLEAAAQEPELPIGKLLMTMRWNDAIAELAAICGDGRPRSQSSPS